METAGPKGPCALRLLGQGGGPREAGRSEFLPVFPSPHGSFVLLATPGLNFWNGHPMGALGEMGLRGKARQSRRSRMGAAGLRASSSPPTAEGDSGRAGAAVTPAALLVSGKLRFQGPPQASGPRDFPRSSAQMNSPEEPPRAARLSAIPHGGRATLGKIPGLVSLTYYRTFCERGGGFSASQGPKRPRDGGALQEVIRPSTQGARVTCRPPPSIPVEQPAHVGGEGRPAERDVCFLTHQTSARPSPGVSAPQAWGSAAVSGQESLQVWAPGKSLWVAPHLFAPQTLTELQSCRPVGGCAGLKRGCD